MSGEGHLGRGNTANTCRTFRAFREKKKKEKNTFREKKTSREAILPTPAAHSEHSEKKKKEKNTFREKKNIERGNTANTCRTFRAKRLNVCMYVGRCVCMYVCMLVGRYICM